MVMNSYGVLLYTPPEQIQNRQLSSVNFYVAWFLCVCVFVFSGLPNEGIICRELGYMKGFSCLTPTQGIPESVSPLRPQRMDRCFPGCNQSVLEILYLSGFIAFPCILSLRLSSNFLIHSSLN